MTRTPRITGHRVVWTIQINHERKGVPCATAHSRNRSFSEHHPGMQYSDWTTAVCLVGAPRAFPAECSRNALLENMILVIPGKVVAFAEFSRASTFNLTSRTTNDLGDLVDEHGVKPSKMPTASYQQLRRAAHAVGVSHARFRMQPEGSSEIDLITPCLRPVLAKPALRNGGYGGALVMWANVRECYKSVVMYEEEDSSGKRFDFVVRIRPYAASDGLEDIEPCCDSRGEP